MTKANIENCVQLLILDWWPLKNLLYPPFNQGYSFGASFRVGCVPRNPFEEEKGFTLHWNVMGKTNSNTNHGFRQLYTTTPNHCQGARLTWIRVFTFNGFEEQVGRRFDCTGSILSQTNICLCLDSTAGRRVFFSQGTSLGSSSNRNFSSPLDSLFLKKCPS